MICVHAFFGQRGRRAIWRLVRVEAAQMTLLADGIGMPDLLVERHIQEAPAQGAQADLCRDMPVIRHGGDTLGAGIGHQGAAQRQDRQALALAEHALVVRQPGFGDREGNTLADGHERFSDFGRHSISWRHCASE